MIPIKRIRGWVLASGIAIVVLANATALSQPMRRFLDGTAVALDSAQRPLLDAEARHSVPLHDAVVAIIQSRRFACSGVLIHRRAVLTARHCRGGRTVMFGADTHGPRMTTRVIDFRGAPNKAIDMALLILEEDAPVAPYSLRRSLEPPQEVRVVGFGCQTPGGCDGAGRRTYFDARLPGARWGCDPSLAASLNCLPSSEMVLPRSIGADTCTGDSGGAVLENTPDGWQVVAITSRGVGGAVLPCGDGGVYVRVQPQLEWIENELEKLSR